jgi:hypothetical protein
MQKKVTLALFVLLVIVLGGVLINLLNEDSSEVRISADYLSPSQKQNITPEKNKTWTEELAGSSKSQFSFPVNELYMQIDLKNYVDVAPKIKSFRLVVDRADRYSIFCIVQTLSSMNLPYVVDKKNTIPIVHVSSKSKNDLNVIVDKLREYDIDSKIVEVWL